MAPLIQRVLLLDDSRQHVLVENSDAGPVLPTAGESDDDFCEVRGFNLRASECIGKPLTTLRWLALGARPDRRREIVFHVDTDDSASEGWTWLSLDAYLGSTPDGDACREALAHVQEDSPRALPWTQPGWFARTRQWITSALGTYAHGETLNLEQLITWQRSCVVRIEDQQQRWYFKQSSTALAHEGALTDLLSGIDDRFAPRVLATDRSARRFVMAELNGVPLEEHTEDLAPWVATVDLLAEVQRRTGEVAQRILGLGCPHRPTQDIETNAAALLADLDVIADRSGERVTATHVERLRERWPEMMADVHYLAADPIPLRIDHGDLHGLNVLIDGTRPRIFDWSDAAWRHPFLGMSMLLFSVAKVLPDPEDARLQMRDRYLSRWTDYASTPKLEASFEAAMRIAPLVRALFYYQDFLPSLPDQREWQGALFNELVSLASHGD